ncbi:hypothetical protein [Sandaracinobacteroides hominis]|uniref:hypothetical protein n=1 Tax=Sandaracinobacteroides hominis TaxID=2780086 RepID=UPI0018F32293|nr:hypothetical protein [Sandaracinobacteroides hominis]
MKRDIVQDKIRQYFVSIGWNSVDNVEKNLMYSPDIGEIKRFFCPHIHRRKGLFQISGKIGVYIPNFEMYWERDNSDPSQKYLPIFMIIGNNKTYGIPHISILMMKT